MNCILVIDWSGSGQGRLYSNGSFVQHRMNRLNPYVSMPNNSTSVDMMSKIKKIPLLHHLKIIEYDTQKAKECSLIASILKL